MTLAEKLTAAQAAVDAQWAKYEAARGRVPYVALLRIDQKLGRLERERDDLRDRVDACEHEMRSVESVSGRQWDGQEVTVDHLVCTKCGFEEWD